MKKIIRRISFKAIREYLYAHPKKVLLRFSALFIILWFLFDDYGILKRIRMEAEHRSLLERQRTEQQKMVDNEKRIQHAREPDSIEKAARERYNFRKPGETLFIIRGE